METSYQYKGVFAICAWMCAVDLIAVWIIVASARLGGATGVWTGLIALVLFSLIGWFLLSFQADVVVSDVGLSRRLWGRTLREISWGNVKRIRVFSMYQRDLGRRVRIFHVFPVRPSGFRVAPSGKVWFRESGDFTALIEHMNRRIAANGIPVEVTVRASGSTLASWRTQDRIDPTP